MIRPVEISDALSKAEVAGKINQIQKAHSEMEQRQVATMLKEKTVVDAERTQETEKSDLLIINKEKQKQDEKDKKDQRKDESGADAEDDDAAKESKHLDVTA